MPDSLFTFDALATLAGASLLTYLIVQYTKRLLDKKWNIPTDLYAVIIGAIVLILSQLAIGADPWDWRIYVLAVFNGFLVALSAGKINDVALKPPGTESKDIGEGM